MSFIMNILININNKVYRREKRNAEPVVEVRPMTRGGPISL